MNRKEHAMGAAVTVGTSTLIFSHQEDRPLEQRLADAIGSGTLAAVFGSLPDWLEPATHPNHRQFFHSLAFGVLVGCGLIKLNRWQPEDDWNRALRIVGLVVGGAYLTHLVMDATTKKSIPLI